MFSWFARHGLDWKSPGFWKLGVAGLSQLVKTKSQIDPGKLTCKINHHIDQHFSSQVMLAYMEQVEGTF